jgi:hypothetical protein
LGIVAASFATVCPSNYFRGHYFITFLPAVAVFAGAGPEAIWQTTRAHPRGKGWLIGVLCAVTTIALAQTIFYHRSLFFELSPLQAARAIYGLDAFPEAVEIGNYIRQHSKPDARVAVMGSEPEIYFYSHRHSATGYIYMYPLMELQKYASEMQRQAIREIEAAKPDYLVFVATPWSWMRQPTSDTRIMDWTQSYLETNFNQIGLIDIQALDRIVYRWDEKAVGAIPRSPLFVCVFKRRDLLD